MALQTLQIRKGNRAGCHICYNTIPYGKERLVINLSTDHYPHHYHLDCILADSPDIITKLSDLITFKRGRYHA